MITLRKVRPVAEHRVAGDAERVFHEFKQTLRLTGVPQNLRTYAAFEGFLPMLWDAMLPNCQTRAFEDAADQLRQEAVAAADGMGRLSVLGKAQLGESQAYQVQAALSLQHYAMPKMLLFQCAVEQALESPGRDHERPVPAGSAELIERGAPARMPPLELIEEPAAEETSRKTLRELRRATGASESADLFRSLALWPRYLATSWERLKPVLRSEGYARTVERLAELARGLALSLPYRVLLSKDQLAREGQDVVAIEQASSELASAQAGLSVLSALLSLDWHAPDPLRRSPFPARARASLGRL